MTSISRSISKLTPQDCLLAAMRAIWISIALALLLPPHLIWQLLKLPSPFAMLFLRIASHALGMRVKVCGTPQQKDVFFVANHVSWHDVAILGGLTGTAFVAQDGVRAWPIIGWLAACNQTVFISRTDKLGVASQVNSLREAIAENWSVTLFPEGTTSDGHGLLPFKPSLFAALTPLPKPIKVQPVFLDFGQWGPDIAWLGEETGWESAWRAFTRKGSYPVIVHFLEPFDPDLLTDRKAICMRARASISGALSRHRAR